MEGRLLIFSDDILVILKFSNQNYFWWLLEEEKEYWIWSNYDQSSKLICHYEMTPLPWFPRVWWLVVSVCWGCSWLVWPPHHHHPPPAATIDHRPVARQPRSSVQQLVTMAVMEAASILLLLSLVSASAGGLVSHTDMVAPSLSPSPCWQCILAVSHVRIYFHWQADLRIFVN